MSEEDYVSMESYDALYKENEQLQSENAKLKKDLETATLALKAIASMPDSSEISRLKEMLERMATALEQYSHYGQSEFGGEVARDALAEYQKWKQTK